MYLGILPVHVYAYAHTYVPKAQGLKRTTDPLELELQQLRVTM